MGVSGLSGMTLPYTPTSYQSYYGQSYSSLYARPSSPAEPPPPPDYSSINPEVATKAIERLVFAGLKQAGFDGSEPGALKRLEAEVVEYVKMLFERAHELANLANRSGPIATDLLLACIERDLDLEQLKKVAGGPRGKKRKSSDPHHIQAMTLLLPESTPPLPRMINVDDDEPGLVIPATLRSIPHYTPALPPKHTYLRTPVAPMKKAAVQSLEKKLQNAALVQESLKSLMLATEDNPDDEDAKLLGAIVNGQAIGHQRKRWKISVS